MVKKMNIQYTIAILCVPGVEKQLKEKMSWISKIQYLVDAVHGWEAFSYF